MRQSLFRRVKILHVIPNFMPGWRWGGPIHAAVGLTREQVRQGHEVTVFTTNLDVEGLLDVPVKRPVDLDGVEVWYWPGRSRRLAFSPDMSRALRARIAHFDIAHVHTIFSYPPTITALWAARLGVPYVIRPAGSLDPICLVKDYVPRLKAIPSRVKKWIYFRTLSRMVLDRASAIHFTTEAEKEAARGLALRAPAIVVPLGVEVDVEGSFEHVGLPQLRGPVKQQKLVLYLSRLDPKKGLELLIIAMGKLARRRDDILLAIAGDGPEPYRRQLIRLVREQGIEARTTFLGAIFGHAKWQLMQQADVFVLPSRQENFGLAIAEAMACKLPVIISSQVNIHSEISRARAGIVIGASPAEIASAVEQICDDPALAREMGECGRRLVVRQFSWPEVVSKLSAAYTEIVRCTNGRAGTLNQQ